MPHPQPQVQGQGSHEAYQCWQDATGDYRRPRGASDSGEPVKEAVAGGRQRPVHPGQEDSGQGREQAKEAELFQQIGKL